MDRLSMLNKGVFPVRQLALKTEHTDLYWRIMAATNKSQTEQEYVTVPISSIEVWHEANVRHTEITSGIDELAESIKQIGLQQPLVVQEVGPNKYRLISGQRRFLALQKLGRKFVPVRLVEKTVDMPHAMVASLAENLHRKPVDKGDLSDACEFLTKQFGSDKEAAKILGISISTFRKYLGYKSVPRELKELVAERRISVSDAIRLSEIHDIPKAIAFANLIYRLAKPTRERYFAALLEDPTSPLAIIEARAERSKYKRRLWIHLPETYANALYKASTDTQKEPEAVAQKAVMEWLEANGYVR
jgi:ParB family chromosome partitioning protein